MLSRVVSVEEEIDQFVHKQRSVFLKALVAAIKPEPAGLEAKAKFAEILHIARSKDFWASDGPASSWLWPQQQPLQPLKVLCYFIH